MKTRNLMVLPLAAVLMLPAVAQQSAPTQDQTQSTTAAAPAASSDQTAAAHQPLVQETREGFWGKLNPFARKKYVQRQMEPIRNRVNELDELSAKNSKDIQDVDARAQEGIKLASAKADQADQHALAAGTQAQQAADTAQHATTRIQTVEQVVSNYDQYQATNQVELRFRSGQTVLNKNAKEALDELAASLKDQKNYIIEVQGFTPGSAATQSSQKMAESVVRYLVINHDIPVYRVFTLGLGNAKLQSADTDASEKPYRGPRVEVSILKNASVDQLNQQAMAAPAASMQYQQGTAAMPNNTGISYDQSKPAQPSTVVPQ